MILIEGVDRTITVWDNSNVVHFPAIAVEGTAPGTSWWAWLAVGAALAGLLWITREERRRADAPLGSTPRGGIR